MCETFAPSFSNSTRNQCARTDERDPCAKFGQAKNIRTSNATEQNVANDNNVEILDFAAFLANCVKIKERLCRMFVRAVAGIDDTRFQSLREKLRRPGGTVTQNDDIRVDRFQNFARYPSVFRLSSGSMCLRKC